VTNPRWDVYPLRALLRRSPRYGIGAAAVPAGRGTHSYIRITDIDDEGRYAPDPRVEVAHPKAADYLLGPGQIVFARTGASVGKSYLYDPADGELVYAGFLINVEPDPRRLNPRYLAAYVQSHAYWNWIERISIRSGQPGINGREYGSLPIPLPEVRVQETIAEVSQHSDDQVGALRRLVAKKEAVRQAVMQDLFHGSREQEESRTSLGVVTEWLSGGTPDRAIREYWTGTIPWISASTLRAWTVSGSDQKVTPAAAQRFSRMAPLNSTLLLVRGSALHSEIRASLVEVPVCFNQDVKALIPRGPLIGKFLMYSIHANAARLLRLVSSAGNTAGVLDTQLVKRFEIWLPERSEQERIVGILDDLEGELDAYSLLLTKAKEIRKGLGQDLLSGRAKIATEELTSV